MATDSKTPQTMAEVIEGLRQEWAQMRQVLERSEAEAKTSSDGKEHGETTAMLEKFNQRLDQLEAKGQRLSMGNETKARTDEEKAATKAAFVQALRYGVKNLEQEQKSLVKFASPSEFKALSLGDDTTGGYLAPDELVTDIIKYVVQFSPVRSVAAVRQTSNRSVMMPVRKGVFAAAWTSEIGQRSETTGYKLGREEIQTHEMYAEVLISQQDLEDSAFDLEALMRDEIAEQFGVAEGKAFLSGTGVGQPEGILLNAGATNGPTLFTTAGAAALTADDLMDVFYTKIKSPYAPTSAWMLHRNIMGYIRKLKDGNNNYLWAPGIAGATSLSLPGAAPSTILDRPYYEAPDLDSTIASNKKPIIFGSFAKGYQIVDRVQMAVQRLSEKYAETGQIALLARKRVGGQVVIPEALVVVKVQ